MSAAAATMTSVEFEARLWEHDGNGSWHFVTVPEEASEELRMMGGPPRGFGSIRVEVTVGGSTWRTSVFPDRDRTFALPMKKAVRRAEDLEEGDTVRVRLQVLEG